MMKKLQYLLGMLIMVLSVAGIILPYVPVPENQVSAVLETLGPIRFIIFGILAAFGAVLCALAGDAVEIVKPKK